MAQVPALLITGFLGSGKTTFINWLVKSHPDTKISLILNEFGDVPIESQFIESNGLQIAELKNGCMCCVAKADIPHVVKYILDAAPQTQYLVVEASGLSDPAPVYAALNSSDLAPLIRLDANICIVDALNFDTTRQKFPLVMSQVGDADLILISKVSQVGENQVSNLKTLLQNNLPLLRILEINSSLSPTLFLDPALPTPSHPHPEDQGHHHHQGVGSVYLKYDQPFDLVKLQTAISSLPPDIIRAKGIISAHTDTSEAPHKLLLQLVGSHSQLLQSTWQPDEPKVTSLIFIGPNVSQSTLDQLLRPCLMS